MMPSYDLVSEEDAEIMLNTHNISNRQLPQISVDDPAILSLREEVEMGANEIDGRIVKFLRRSLKAGISPFYRVVVRTPIATDPMKVIGGDSEYGIKPTAYYYGWTTNRWNF